MAPLVRLPCWVFRATLAEWLISPLSLRASGSLWIVPRKAWRSQATKQQVVSCLDLWRDNVLRLKRVRWRMSEPLSVHAQIVARCERRLR